MEYEHDKLTLITFTSFSKLFDCGYVLIYRYFLAFLLLWNLNKQVVLIPENLTSLRLNRFLKSGKPNKPNILLPS